MLLFLCSLTAVAQVPDNLNFEEGSFWNWKTMTSSDDGLLVDGPQIPDRHAVVAPFSDTWTGSQVSSVLEGSFSAKLGNDNGGHESEAIETRFWIDDDQLVLYRYSVVLDDPWHAPDERPALDVDLHTGTPDTDGCRHHRIQMNDSLGPLHTHEVNGRKIRFSNRAAGILEPDSAGYVALRFTTRDCKLGGHFGYAYVDAKLIKRRTDVYFCKGDYVRINAPGGFRRYLWSTGDSGAEISLTPRDGMQLHCKLVPDFGCPVTIIFDLKQRDALDCRQHPKFFTPNGDGIHDIWQPDWQPGDLRCRIYSKNGTLLTTIECHKNWDGSVGNLRCPQGDYWFELESAAAPPRRDHFSLIR